ncbi:MAG: hypothetical protein ACR2NL_11325 [Acidimicrobiia bacterium]
MSNGTPPVPGAAPQKKKGLPALAWVAIGCGGLMVVGIVLFFLLGAFVFSKGKEVLEDATGSGSISDFVEDMQENPTRTAAETMIRLNPELDILSTDESAGTITFRNSRTGEEATLNFEDIAEGRFSMTTDEGDFTVNASEAEEGGGVVFTGPQGETRFGASADLSDVPDWVPGYPGSEDLQGTMQSTSAEGLMGAFSAKTTDDAQTVVDYFKKLFEERGYKIGAESMTRTGEGAFGAVNGESVEDGRMVNVVVIENVNDGETVVTVNYTSKTD